MRRKKKSENNGFNVWRSYSDMMAALLLLFVLIIAITLGIYKMKTTDLEQAELQLNNTRTELEESEKERQASLQKLEDAYARQTMTEEELQSAYQMIDECQKRTAGYCRNPDRYYWGIADEVFQLYHAGRSADRFHQFFYRCAVQI